MAASRDGAISAPAPGEVRLNDATAALMALGFKPADAQASVRGALTLLGETATVEQLVRACLKRGA
jgi:Holliday junction resolvasome RuvABC DNA-binding subunit